MLAGIYFVQHFPIIEIAPPRRAEQWFPTVTTPGDEVQIMVSVEAF